MVKKIDTIKRLRLFGDFLMLGTFLLLLWLFFSAYLNDEFSTTVHINNYGEAHIEMIILVFFLLPLFLFTTALSFIDWRQTWKARQKILSQNYLMIDTPRSRGYSYDDVLICPRCDGRFIVDRIYTDGSITCPKCGLKGTYDQEDMGPTTGNGNNPTVKIIKDIRR